MAFEQREDQEIEQLVTQDEMLGGQAGDRRLRARTDNRLEDGLVVVPGIAQIVWLGVVQPERLEQGLERRGPQQVRTRGLELFFPANQLAEEGEDLVHPLSL